MKSKMPEYIEIEFLKERYFFPDRQKDAPFEYARLPMNIAATSWYQQLTLSDIGLLHKILLINGTEVGKHYIITTRTLHKHYRSSTRELHRVLDKFQRLGILRWAPRATHSLTHSLTHRESQKNKKTSSHISQPFADPCSKPTELRGEIMQCIEKAYQMYPKKVGKKKGMLKLKSKIKTLEEAKELIKAVESYCAHLSKERVEKQYIKHFSTFSNEYEDWTEPDVGETYDISEKELESLCEELDEMAVVK